jgi:ubiquinone/menaquinone biosynthesis C-methylase UbiE
VNHADHVELLHAAVTPGGTWADIGAGTGAFTLALAELLGPEGRIVAVDRDRGALAQNAEVVRAANPGLDLETVVADFTRPLDLRPLDGLVAANSLHFVPRDRQVEVIRALASHLVAGAPFVVVEYDADQGNPWVPHPFTFDTWLRMAVAAGLAEPRRLHRVPSRFLGGIYSAAAWRP